MWWNDEGETQWFTYSWWNEAQQQMYAQALPNQRFFTLNRAFQPGMQKYAAVTWTGDRQDCSHATVLTFTTAGQLYTACDMTAPSATILVRQYQNAVFLPIMRVHAMHGTPRFPFLWGQEAMPAFRYALNLRYRFVPYMYSMAWQARTQGQPLAVPASYVLDKTQITNEFPLDVADATYMFGRDILPADVCTSNNADPAENTTHVNVPPGMWYRFNETQTIVGPILGLTYTNVALEEMVVFIRSGAILLLQHDIVQYTDALGGALDVQVYSGADGSFVLVEDDGISNDYITNPMNATRLTSFTYTDATRTLSWKVTGGFSGGQNLYKVALPVLFVSNQTTVVAPPQSLGVDGSVTFASIV